MTSTLLHSRLLAAVHVIACDKINSANRGKKKTFHDNSRLKSVKCKLWCLRLLSLWDLNFRFGTRLTKSPQSLPQSLSVCSRWFTGSVKCGAILRTVASLTDKPIAIFQLYWREKANLTVYFAFWHKIRYCVTS